MFQAALLAALAVLGWLVVRNVGESLADRRVSVQLRLPLQRAGFDIPFRLISWTTADSYGRALWVCFLNTLLAAALGIAVATALGLLLGIMRLSENWLVRNVALGVVEIVRNTPQLLQIVFWYVVVIQSLPPPRAGITLPGGSILSVRGLVVPIAVWSPNAPSPARASPGAQRSPPPSLGAGGAAPHGSPPRASPRSPVPAAFSSAAVETIQYPVLRGFNFSGGFTVPPELIALVAGLSIYSSAFIAEIVRGSIQGIVPGQGEAAQSLGLSRMQTMFLVVLPQALRIMVPQVTGQYLNLTKSTSLGAAVAYPELVQIFAGTVLNQSGRAIEAMVLVMGVFLAINLVTTALMDGYNRRVAIVER